MTTLERQDFTRLSDLDLNDIWYDLDGADLTRVNPAALREFMMECLSRGDEVLKTAGVEISAQFRDDETLKQLYALVLNSENDENTDIFLIDELAEREIPNAYDTFRRFLAPHKPDKVRAFCAKVLFYDEFECDIVDLEKILENEKDDFVRARMIALLCSLTGRSKWMNELTRLTYNSDIDVAREARAVRKHLLSYNE